MPTDEIPDDIAALLRDARATDVPPVGAKDRVWAKTMERIDGPGSGSAAGAPATTSAALSGFAAGVLSGVAGTYAVFTFLAAPPAAVPVPVPAPVVESAQTPVALAPTPAATPVRGATKPAPAAVRTPAPVAIATPSEGSHATERATERAWLDAARTALSQGDFDSAMSNLETAGTRFPEGSLSEERDALAIHVLIARGHLDSADLAIDTFRTRHPGSLFILAIEEARRKMESKR